MKKIIILFVLLSVQYCLANPVFQGTEGLVVIEVESTTSSLDKWVKKTSVENYSGECHLEFTGNKPALGPATSPLEYIFTVDKDGIYFLHIRCHKRLEGQKPDKCNDCYVRLEGDFESGGKTPMEFLAEDTKLFGGSDKGWGWSVKLDKKHKKFPAVYKLKAGEKYKLVISGRSKRYNMDRIVFRHEGVKLVKAQDTKLPESAVVK